MSGRLIILRHKKWNVWNRENIEKVKRDERLHREEMERKKENERKIHSELILDQFHDEGGVTTQGQGQEGGGGDGHGDDDHRYEDREMKRLKISSQKIENEEYKREKEEKELLEKRREGSAPWALGEGSSEFKKMTPWYLEKKSDKHAMRIGGRVLSGDQAQAALDRDLARKYSEDPMSIYLYTSECKEEESVRPSQLIVHESVKRKETHDNPCLPGMSGMNTFVLGNEMMSSSSSSLNDEERMKRKKRKHHKKEKKQKKENKKEKKHRKSRREDEKDTMSSSSSSSDRETTMGRQSSSSLSQYELELLRNRRTQREKMERLREQKILHNL